MGFQEFLLAVLKNTTSRTTGLIYLGIGVAISAVEYLNAQPKTEHYLTNSAGNILMYVGAATVTVRSLERWKKDFEKRRSEKNKAAANAAAAARQALAGQERSNRTARANYESAPSSLKSAIKFQCKTGKQRFYVKRENRLLEELKEMHLVVPSVQVGDVYTPGAYVVHPAIWMMKDEITEDETVHNLFAEGLFEWRN